jgi:hypothetical protein
LITLLLLALAVGVAQVGGTTVGAAALVVIELLWGLAAVAVLLNRH